MLTSSCKISFIKTNTADVIKISSLCIASLFYQVSASAQMTPSTPPPYLNYQSFIGANGSNGPDAYCDAYKPQDGNPGKSPSSYSTINLTSATSPSYGTGILVTSTGGTGGTGGNGYSCFSGYGGGSGGTGGSISISNGQSPSTSPLAPTVTLTGTGIMAVSQGGRGGTGGGTGTTLSAGNGGHGGSGGGVTISNYGVITTSNLYAFGLYGASVGGGGGSGGENKSAVSGSGGDGMAGGDGGTVSLSNSGNITTANAYAMFAISMGGYGGDTGSNSGIFGSPSPTSGYGGPGGSVTVQNLSPGQLVTEGAGQAAMFAISVGGGGGDAGRATGIGQFGAIGGPGASGGLVTALNSGTIQTMSSASIGIGAISVGGGGGSGGSAQTALLGGSGSGGGGGNGGHIIASNSGGVYTGGGAAATSALISGGGLAPAIAAVSVGGGGGVAGSVITGGVGFSLALGGKGGDGGSGGTIWVDNSHILQTTEIASAGIFAGSVGGGGGLGGGAFSASAGPDTISMSFGGSGGSGGNGGMVGINCGQSNGHSSSSSACNGANALTTPTLGARVTTMGDISPGIVAVSVGGGGGHGGYGVSLAAGTNLAASLSVGGTGGDGGSGGAVYVGTNGVPILTGGDFSSGIVALSVGGGGGHGGITMYRPDYIPGGAVASTSMSINVGGSGGGSGAGGPVIAENISSLISTQGDRASGIMALSVGGHGGHGGLASGGALGLNTSVSVSVGGKGGSGNEAGSVTVYNTTGNILTLGSDAHAIEAISVGGGGGSGGWSAGAGVSLGGNAASFTIGGTGGSGGSGGAVTVNNSGSLSVTGLGGAGIIAMSVGGGGGNGGSSASSDVSLNGVFTETVGGYGTGGAAAGSVTVANTGGISTGLSYLNNPSAPALGAQGIVALSVGAGGGRGGVAVSGDVNASSDASTQSLMETIGGGSGGGGTGGTVNVTNNAAVNTFGDMSNGIIAMSIGGRGGLGGIAVSGSVSLQNTTNITLGSNGGNGGKGGSVTVTNSSSIVTGGFRAIGISAQSLGGHGGMGGISVGTTLASEDSGGAVITLGGTGGKGGVAASTTINHEVGALVSTIGPFSAGLVAQSIGGDGGVGGLGLGISSTTKAPAMVLGGSGGQGAIGGSASIYSGGTVTSTGLNSVGILAQSIGGNGGLSGATIAGGSSDRAGDFSNNLGSTGGNGATGGAALVSVGGPVITSGTLSTGVAVESIGGGGGRAGVAMTLDTGNPQNLQPFGAVANIGATGGGGGNGGTADLYQSGYVNTTGTLSEALYAGSIGGGGGSSGLGFFNFTAGSKSFDMSVGGQSGSGGNGGAVQVYANNTLPVTKGTTISSTGEYSHGIFAQSIGGGGGSATGIHKQTSAAGAFEGLMRLGSTGTSGGSGGTVNIYSGGAIQTTGFGSSAIFGQSVGGGGGQTVASLIAATMDISIPGTSIQFVIGSGAASNPNGTAGTNTSTPSTTISLTSFSETTLSAGSASSMALGGYSTDAGNGGAVSITSGAVISTTATMSDGIKIQSIGGGGGVSAFGDVLSGSPFAASSMFLGGGESGGGVGGAVTVANNASITTSGALSLGIFAQSVGGGGGDARHASIANEGLTSAFVVGQGLQSGAKGGNSGVVTVTNNQQVVTTGPGSDGVLAQSIGGGGGFSALSGNAQTAANFATSLSGVSGSSQTGLFSNSFSAGSTTSSTFAGISGSATRAGGSVSTLSGASMAAVLGASGGSIANYGNTVTLSNNGGILTYGDGSSGIVAQSVGAGGGVVREHLSNFDQSQTSMSLMLGAFESAYGNGEVVSVTNNTTSTNSSSGIQTMGRSAIGILAQSIGGGGGLGMMTETTAGLGGSASLTMSLGGAGKSYGQSSSVTINSTSLVTTVGDLSQGILAQSISNGGGVAKGAIYAALPGAQFSDVVGSALTNKLYTTSQASAGLAVGAVLGSSSSIGSSAAAVTLNASSISTSGVRSGAIVAQSIGGGGGVADISTYALNSGGFVISALLGGAVTAEGSSVTVNTSGSIATSGALSDGILAQSISGGGGSLGIHDVGISAIGSGTLSFMLGSSLQNSNVTNSNSVVVKALQSVSTTGYGSSGITAQAIGAGGGLLAYSYATDFITNLGVNGTLGSASTVQSNGYAVSVQTDTGVSTSGNYAPAIVAQSIGGGGGRIVGNQFSPSSSSIRMGSSNGGGSGGNTTVTTSGLITTAGQYSHGVIAQSIGAGGGLVDLPANKVSFGATSTSSGSAGSVTVTQSGNISTLGTGIGIVAQSIGGGGGIATVSGNPTITIGNGSSVASNGGSVSVTVNGSISTSGPGSPGVVALSVGGGGGIAINADQSSVQTIANKSNGSGGAVTVNVNNSISTTGMGSDGVVAASVGGGGGLLLSKNPTAVVGAKGTGSAGTVSVKVANNVSILATGLNSQGIYAPQVNGVNDPEISIGYGALVSGGANGVGVRFDGAINTLNNDGTIQTVDGVTGNAVVSDSGVTTVNNTGVTIGSFRLKGSDNAVNNLQSGRVYTTSIDLDRGGVFTNAGYLEYRAIDPISTGIVNHTGNIIQTSTGVLGIRFDHAAGRADTLSLDPEGRLNLAGYIRPALINAGLISPSSSQATMINRNNGLLSMDELGVISTAIMTYGLIKSPDSLQLSSTADFNPAGLSDYGSQVGRSIGEYQKVGSNTFFQTATAQLVHIPSVPLLDRAYVGLAGTSISSVPKVTYEAVNRAIETVSDRMNSWRVGEGSVAPATNPQALATAQGLSGYSLGSTMVHGMTDSRRSEQGLLGSGPRTVRSWITPFQAETSTHYLSNKIYGGTFGIETESNDGRFLAGAGFTLSQSNFTYDSAPTAISPGSASNYGGSFYFGAKHGAAYFSAIGYIGGSTSRLNRQIQMLGISDSTKLNIQNFSLAARLEAGYNFLLNPNHKNLIKLTPFVAIQPTQIQQKSTNETFSSLGSGFNYGSQTNTAMPISLGAELSGAFDLSEKEKLRPFIRAAYVKDAMNSGGMAATFNPSEGISLFSTGTPSNGNAWVFKGGVTYNNGGNASVYATVDVVQGVSSDRLRGVGGTVGMIYRW